MIVSKQNLTGRLTNKQLIQGVINKATEIIEIYPETQTKTITPTKQTQTIIPDENVYALSQVTVNPIPNNYIEPQGQKKITENGNYDITNFASANVEIEIGKLTNAEYTEANDDLDDILQGNSQVDSLKDFNDIVNVVISNFNNSLENIINSYPVYTENLMTLYTPDERCKNYVIHKKSNNKFRIIWSSIPYAGISSATTISFYCIGVKQMPSVNARFNDITNLFSLESPVTSANLHYYSNEFNTPEEIINAISNPTGNITYTLWVSGNSFSAVIDSPYEITYSNTNIFNCRNVDRPILVSRKISASETYEVKPS